MHPFSCYLAIYAALTLWSALDSPKQTIKKKLVETRHEFLFPAMGVEFRVIYYASSANEQGLHNKIKQRVDEIEDSLSDYRHSSEAMQFCRSAPHSMPQQVSHDFWALSRISQCISKQSNGAFDISVGNLSHAWRMARKRNRLPSDEKIRSALNQTDYRRLTIHPENHLQLSRGGMKLDFGGIAKGYAADQVMALLKRQGITSALVDAGGDICVSAAPPKKEYWQVRIETTAPIAGTSEPAELKLVHAAVATSGDLYQYLTIDGTKHSHIIDPRTGQATTSIAMATVIAPTATLADAYASAVSVLGIKQGISLIETLSDTDCQILQRDPGNLDSIQPFTSRCWQRTAGLIKGPDK